MATDSTRRLHHNTPAWVEVGAIFHIRIRIARGGTPPLTQPSVANDLLASAELYHSTGRWFNWLFLLMPDHVHALVAFPRDCDMRTVIGRWKAWQTRTHGVRWQDNFFDHRIRNQHELHVKAEYIRQNPVVKGLCRSSAEWLWVISR
jgi:putative transposase